MSPFNFITICMIASTTFMGCATSSLSSKADKLERQGQLVQAAGLHEQIASEHTGKLAAKSWYRAGQLWMDPDNPQKSFKRALICFNKVDRSKADKQVATNTRLWISALTQLAFAKQKASSLKETAAALKDAAAGSERLHPPK